MVEVYVYCIIFYSRGSPWLLFTEALFVTLLLITKILLTVIVFYNKRLDFSCI